MFLFNTRGMNLRLGRTFASGVNSVVYSITDYLDYLDPVSLHEIYLLNIRYLKDRAQCELAH